MILGSENGFYGFWYLLKVPWPTLLCVPVWDHGVMSIRNNWEKVPKEKRKDIRKWTIRYRDENGRSREKSFDLKDDALKFESEVRRAKDRGERVSRPVGVTASELWGENSHGGMPEDGTFLYVVIKDGVKGNNHPASFKTLTKYRNCFNLYIQPRWGDTRLVDIRHEDVASWIRGLRYASKDEPASAYLKRETSGIFRSFMDHAVAEGYIPSNPALDLAGRVRYRPGPERKKPKVYLSMRQLRILASCCEGYESMVLTAGLGGLRFGELTALTISDLSLGEKSMINVNKANTDDRGAIHLKETKTGEDRNVPLPELVAEMLAKEVEGRSPDERVWSWRVGGGVIRHNSFSKSVLKDRVRTSGEVVPGALTLAREVDPTFPQMTFHDLRHTAVSLAVKAGANVKVVQRIAGHSSATLTLDTYAGLFDDDLHDSASRLNAELSKVW